MGYLKSSLSHASHFNQHDSAAYTSVRHFLAPIALLLDRRNHLLKDTLEVPTRGLGAGCQARAQLRPSASKCPRARLLGLC